MIDTVNFRILWEELLLCCEKYCLSIRRGIVIYYSFFYTIETYIDRYWLDSAAITCDAVTIYRIKFER